jgi:hypothetical protein
MTKVTARYRVGILAAIARRVDVSVMRDTVSQDAGTVKSKERTRVRVSVLSKTATTVLFAAITMSLSIVSNAFALPEGREYEMVSPVYKGGYGVVGIEAVAPDGKAWRSSRPGVAGGLKGCVEEWISWHVVEHRDDQRRNWTALGEGWVWLLARLPKVADGGGRGGSRSRVREAKRTSVRRTW